MNNEIAIMLMSHGNFSKAAIESAELIVGKQENYDTLSVFLADQVDSLKQEMFDKIEKLCTTKGLLVLTDIIGGTPMNLAGNLVGRENTIICSGLNLPILIEVLMNRDKEISDIKEILEDSYSKSLTIVTSEDLGEEDEEDDLLL